MEITLTYILSALYFFLPAYMANMMPVLLKRMPLLDKPIWERKLGNHKTWRGLIAGVLTGLLVFWLQKIIFILGYTRIALIDYADYSIILGLLLGFGAMLGDLVKSYYKRKAGLKPGESWKIFDQVDFAVGAIILGWFIYVPPVSAVIIILLASPVLHILFNHLGYWLGINKSRW